VSVLRDNPSQLDNDFLSRFSEFRDFRTRRSVVGDVDTMAEPIGNAGVVATPEELIDQSFNEITNELRASLLDRIMSASPAFFEKVIVDLLLRMGYGGSRSDAGRRIGRSGDGGIDGVINEDPLGLDVVYLQAKRYAAANQVTPDQLRGFAGSLLQRGATKGVFVTTSRFTEQAKDFARTIKQQRIVLIDGDELTKLLVKHGVGVRTERTLELRKVDLDYFDEEQDET